VIIIFELTGDYQIILPLMFAIVLSASASSLLTRDTIYTLKLHRRGIDIRRGRAANVMEVLAVADAMTPVPDPLPHDLALNEIIARFAEEKDNALPVVDAHGAFRGMVTSHQVEEAMRDNAFDAEAGDLVVETATLRPGQTLEQALTLLVRHETTGLPVLGPDGRHVMGWLTHRDVLHAYNDHLERRVAQATGQAREAAPPVFGRGEETSPLARLRGYRIVDLEITRDQPPVGSRVADIQWPPSSLLIAVRRDGSSFVPTGQTDLRKGDRLTVLVPAEHAGALAETIGAARTAPSPQDGLRPGRAPRPDPVLRITPPHEATILEPQVSPDSPVAGRRVRELNLGEGALLVAIRRGETAIVPSGDTRLESGDHVVVIAGLGRAERVLETFRSKSGP
ncbi:MAG TPA: TrkA C-terminal domain-containing protein, partial [bacterium]|nr:TrkA C-terminal domain-containing protein [bacterium]